MRLEHLVERLRSMCGDVESVRRSDGGVELVTCCPFCGKDGHLYVNANKGVYDCKRCAARGTLRQLLNAPVRIVVSDLPDLPRSSDTEDKEREVVFREAGDVVPFSFLPPDHPVAAYVRGRGFDTDALEKDYGVGVVVSGRTFARGKFDTTGTVYFPIIEDGETKGWICRLPYNPKEVSDEDAVALGWKVQGDHVWRPPKYWLMPGFDKSRHLVYWDRAKEHPFVIVTEGVFDAIRIGPPAVAIIGKVPSRHQLDLLAEGWKTIVLLLDPDASDEQANAARELADKAAVVSVTLNGWKDAGEAPHDAVWAAIRAAAAEQGVSIPSGMEDRVTSMTGINNDATQQQERSR